MNLKRRTFMQSAAASLASIFGLDAAEEMLDRAKPRKVMVPGVDFDVQWLDYSKMTLPELHEIVRKYRTKNYTPARGALQQELVMGESGRWRTGDWMGREGASVGELMGGGPLPIGCVLGPRAKLVFVDEARKTLRFELSPLLSDDYYDRVGLGGWPHMVCPP